MDQNPTVNADTQNAPVTATVTPPVSQTPTAPQQATQQPVQTGATSDVRTIVTVLALLLAYPIGFILMWVWSKWKLWVKLLISIPVTLLIVFFILATMLVAINPAAQFEKAEKAAERANFMKECTNTKTVEECSQEYLDSQLGPDQIDTADEPVEVQ